jgi:3',5'-cyclic AMP phosphodiesterase CpdA
MDRRHFLQTAALAAGAFPIIGRGAADQTSTTPAPTAAPVPPQPTVTSITSDSVAIVWGVDVPSAGFVEYGPTPELGKVACGSAIGLREYDDSVISIHLSDLKPGERVYYRAVSAPVHINGYNFKREAGIASPVFEFRMPAPGDTARIAVWNDTHQQHDALEALGKATDLFGPELLVLNGDLVYDGYHKNSKAGGREEEMFIKTFFELGMGSADWPKRPVSFVRGNHDTRGTLARRLPRYSPTPRPDGYHGLLRVGPVAIIQLDTGEDKEGPNIYGGLGDFAAYRELQKAWLEQAVTDPRFAQAPYKIVFCHIPLRWKNPAEAGDWCSDGDARWSPLLAKAGVQAVISGHTHEFWHSEPEAARPYHQIVAGGPKTVANKWSPTPTTLTTLVADANKLVVRVAEALSGNELLKLELKRA